MSAIDAALDTIDAVAAEGDLAPDRRAATELELESAGEPIVLPDGKLIYPPRLHGQPIDELACALLDMDDPAALDVPAADRPARRRQEPDRARDRPPAVDRPRPRGRASATASRSTGSSRCSRGPSSDEYFFRYDYVPLAGAGGQVHARGLGVRAGDARGLGGDDRRGQHRPRRLPALDQRHARRPAVRSICRRPARPCAPSPASRCCSPTTPGWSARPTSPTPGTRASRPRSRSASNWAGAGRSSARPSALVRRGDARWTASASPARTG